MQQRPKYQMTRVRSGDYLVPANDGKTLWRFTRYDEDGSLETDGKKIVGTFWRASRFDGTMDGAERLVTRDPIALLSWEHWFELESLLPTRKAAVELMLAATKDAPALREP